ncbi:hypothetical protein JZM21_33765, partial [Escherichia coli]|uniref:hypothetical protein n=1 Tax=Escherichia coli TaxID=562 RepID=UPI0019D1236F
LLHVPADGFERSVKFRIKHRVHDGPTPVLRNATSLNVTVAAQARPSAPFAAKTQILRGKPARRTVIPRPATGRPRAAVAACRSRSANGTGCTLA